MTTGGFWSMGGYARFVWPCYALAGVVCLWNVWAAHRFLAAARVRTARALAMAVRDRP